MTAVARRQRKFKRRIGIADLRGHFSDRLLKIRKLPGAAAVLATAKPIASRQTTRSFVVEILAAERVCSVIPAHRSRKILVKAGGMTRPAESPLHAGSAGWQQKSPGKAGDGFSIGEVDGSHPWAWGVRRSIFGSSLFRFRAGACGVGFLGGVFGRRRPCSLLTWHSRRLRPSTCATASCSCSYRAPFRVLPCPSPRRFRRPWSTI